MTGNARGVKVFILENKSICDVGELNLLFTKLIFAFYFKNDYSMKISEVEQFENV